MSDFEALAAAVAAGIAAVGQGKQFTQQASIEFGEATAALAAASAGSAIADLPGVTDQARNETDALIGKLEKISDSLTAYLTSLGRSAAPKSPQVNTPKSQKQDRGRPEMHTTTAAQTKPDPVSQTRVEELRQALPPPVQPGEHQKTHGQWVTGSGSKSAGRIVSGRDDMEAAAVKFFKDQGARRMPTTVADVEVKLAVHMQNEGITNATVAVNNEVCKGPFGCDTLLPKILPQGSTLTVYGTTPDGQPTGATYLGHGKKP